MTKTVGGCASTASVTITVNEVTAPTLSPQTICEGETVQIGTANDATLQYQWSPTTDLNNAYISNPTFSGTSSTSYTLTVVDGNGCIAEVATSVSVNPAPAITITLPDTTICDANATSIVINAGVDPTGSYAYQWSPTTYLDNPNTLNPEFFIPGEGDYVYTLEVIDQSTGCSIFGSTTMSVRSSNIPEVVAFAIQPSCVDNVPQSDGYLQISAATYGDRYHWSTGNAFDDNGGTNTFDNATSLSGASYPLQIAMGQANPSGSQDYTIRVYSGSADCYTDIIVTMNEQDCTVGCDCEEYIYLNAPLYNDTYKFLVDMTDGSLEEITNPTGGPWIENQVVKPHGVAADINGNFYIGNIDIVNDVAQRGIDKFSCMGDLIQADAILPGDGAGGGGNAGYSTNIYTIGNRLFTNHWLFSAGTTNGSVSVYDLCTGDLIGEYLSCGNRRIWDFSVIEETNQIMLNTNQGIAIGDLDTNFNGACIPIAFTDNTREGITVDTSGNIYVRSSSELRKYDNTGVLLCQTSLTLGGDGGRGMVYSQNTGYLYLAGNDNDCISIYDPTDCSYVGQAMPNDGDVNSKAISINKECCPTNNNITIDTTLCAASISDVLFLQELINCDGTICEGVWQQGMANSGLTYNECDNSITIDALNACGSFTLESDGMGNNPAMWGIQDDGEYFCERCHCPCHCCQPNLLLGRRPGSFYSYVPGNWQYANLPMAEQYDGLRFRVRQCFRCYE